MHAKIAIAALLLVLGIVNWSIYGKERHLAKGKIVYLELAPVDPRSLMQGDYMALRFRMANEVFSALPRVKYKHYQAIKSSSADGYAVVKLDAEHVGHFSTLYNGQTLADDELLMRYRLRNGRIKFATNAFFFQEGHAKFYQPARYGQFRVDKHGELLLVAMHDKDLNRLGPEKSE
jgi:uncharacterized membrane-anchored protein